MSDIIPRDLESVYASIKKILDEARSKVMRTVNFAMVRAYWEIGLEQALTGRLQDFMLELGKGFSFVARQKRTRYTIPPQS